MTSGFRQTNELWQDIQQEKSKNQKRLKMLEMAKLLIEYADLDDSLLNELSKSDELTDFFLEYQNIGNFSANFFKRALPHLEEELVNGDFQTQIEELEKELSNIDQKYKDCFQDYSKYKSKKAQLNADSKKLKDMENELNELKELEAALKPENMKDLADNINQLKQKTEEIKPEYERLSKEQENLENILMHMQEMINSCNQPEDMSNPTIQKLIDFSTKLSDLLDQDWDQYDEHLSQVIRKLKNKNKNYLDVLNEMDTSLEKLKQTAHCEEHNQTVYNEHFNANNELIKDFDKTQNGVEKELKINVEQHIKSIESLSGQIKKDLKQFDNEIMMAIVGHEEVVKKIRRLNKTSLV